MEKGCGASRAHVVDHGVGDPVCTWGGVFARVLDLMEFCSCVGAVRVIWLETSLVNDLPSGFAELI